MTHLLLDRLLGNVHIAQFQICPRSNKEKYKKTRKLLFLFKGCFLPVVGAVGPDVQVNISV